MTRTWARYVAIGDSSTEGLDDPDGNGGYRGWSTRLAERIAAVQGSVHYANLAVRGRRTRQILHEQLPRAAAMRPDLATVFAGTNDLMVPRFDADAYGADLKEMLATLAGGGATVLTFTMPDLAPVMPLARLISSRLAALNEAIRAVSAEAGAIVVDFAWHRSASDPRLWSDDRLHANAAGHELIAAALAHALGLPGTDDAWSRPLSPAPPATRWDRVAAEVLWARRHLLPWAWRHLRGKSSGDGRGPRRPHLAPFPDQQVAPAEPPVFL